MNGTLILGIGNSLMCDDGVGVHAVREMSSRYAEAEGVRCIDGGTLGYLLIGEFEASDRLIVIDAAHLNAVPGTVAVFINEAMDRYLACHPNRSVHEVGLSDLVAMAQLGGYLPAQRALIAIQPASTDWGIELSPAVISSLPEVYEKAQGLVGGWQS